MQIEIYSPVTLRLSKFLILIKASSKIDRFYEVSGLSDHVMSDRLSKTDQNSTISNWLFIIRRNLYKEILSFVINDLSNYINHNLV